MPLFPVDMQLQWIFWYSKKGDPDPLDPPSGSAYVLYIHNTPTSNLTMSPRERMNIIWECLALIDVLGVQPTVTFPIGDHVNVLHDYKKTRPSKSLKLLKCLCHHFIDILFEFSQNDIFLTLLKCLNVPYPSMFTHFCINYYAHAPCGERIAKHPSTY